MDSGLELRLFIDADAGDELEQMLAESGAEVRQTKQVEDPSSLKFDVGATVEIALLVSGIIELAPRLASFVKRRDRRVIVYGRAL
jgi:hypothetical protein